MDWRMVTDRAACPYQSVADMSALERSWGLLEWINATNETRTRSPSGPLAKGRS